MSTTVVVAPQRKTQSRRSRRNRRKKAAQSEVKIVEQRVGPKIQQAPKRDRVVLESGMSNQGSSRIARRAARRLEQLTIAHPESQTKNIKIFKGPIMSLYTKLTANFTPDQHLKLRSYLKTLVDPFTNVFQLGTQARLPDANSIQSAIVRSRKIIPINVLWDGSTNQGKFSLASRPVMGSFDNFDYFQDYLIGENGWPTPSNNTFTNQSLYVNEFNTGTNQSWPLAYDPNYPALACAPAQSFTLFGTSTTSFGPTYPANSSLTYNTPLGQTGVGNGILPLQRTAALDVNVTSNTVNIVTVPPGLWFISATHTFNYTTQIPVPDVEPVNASCTLTSLNYNWVVGNDLNVREGVSFRPGTLDPTWPAGVGYMQCTFYIQNTSNRNSQFQYTWVNNGTGSTAISTTLFRGLRQTPENGIFSSVDTFVEDDFNIGILSQTQSTQALGLASKIRPTGMSVWFKPAIAPIAQGGVLTVAYLPRGVLETNFLADAGNVSLGQAQEFSSLDQLPQNVLNCKIQDGCFAWWRPSDAADYKYRDIIDTQAQLNSDEEQYGTLIISGVCPPTPDMNIDNTIQNIGYVEVVRVFEIQTASQLLNTQCYVGATAIVDVALQLIDQGGLSLVHENPLHLKDIVDWGKRIGLKVYQIGKSINEATKAVTGMDAITLGRKSLPLLAGALL